MKPGFYLLLIPIAVAVVACADTTEAPSPKEPTSLEQAPDAEVLPTQRTQPSTRNVDFSQVPEVRQAISRCVLNWRFQGTTSSLDLSPCRIAAIAYEALGEDSRDEAIIEIAGLSGMGRQPALAVLAFGYDEGTLRMLLLKETETGPLTMYLANGQLAVGKTLFGPQEGACCPSEATMNTYAYGSTGLLRDAVETVACASSHPLIGSVACPRP